jgi:hypothetical protein
MPMTKLTLSADKKLVAQAKKLAAKEGTSLSSMLSRFLRAMIEEKGSEKPGPVTRAATGLVTLPAGKSDSELLEEALSERHGL